jgi:hypothetical protein
MIQRQSPVSQTVVKPSRPEATARLPCIAKPPA